ncbi:MAG TPA: 50S ribosomal protein L25 [Firmicutes bacterium]|jgi:large subunit ribosomal protein L25|nr:50S ribosomal protein L25 [Bacillota bacterium]
MESVLKATVRKETGKGAVHRLRQAGQIPAVIYGEGQANVCLDAREAQKFFNTNGYSQLITLQLDNEGKVEKRPVLVKEVQFDPVKGNPLHLDFLQVSMQQKVVMKVPVVLVGEEKRVNDGSVIDTALYEVEVSCLPADIPAKIEVDISGLTMGNSITVADLQAPEGIEFVTPATEAVVVAYAPRVEEEKPAEEEEEKATEPQQQPEE